MLDQKCSLNFGILQIAELEPFNSVTCDIFCTCEPPPSPPSIASTSTSACENHFSVETVESPNSPIAIDSIKSSNSEESSETPSLVEKLKLTPNFKVVGYWGVYNNKKRSLVIVCLFVITYINLNISYVL